MISLALVLAAVCALLFGSLPMLAITLAILAITFNPLVVLVVIATATAWAISRHWR